MKKGLLIVLMFGLCVAFFLIASNQKFIRDVGAEKIEIQSKLEEVSKKIDSSYPETPKALIKLNNELMGYLYSKNMQEADVDFYVETIRKLYDEVLLALNPKEDQKSAVLIELQKNAERSIKLLGSEIEDVTLIGEDAEVKVTHYLSTNDIVRVYKLTQTSGKWKIVSWENVKQDSAKSEE